MQRYVTASSNVLSNSEQSSTANVPKLSMDEAVVGKHTYTKNATLLSPTPHNSPIGPVRRSRLPLSTHPNESIPPLPRPCVTGNEGDEIVHMRLCEANAKFQDAAQKLACLRLNHASPFRLPGKLVREPRAADCAAQKDEVLENSAQSRQAMSPRKLLWPTSIDQRCKIEAQQNRRTSYRERTEPLVIRKPKRSFVVHRSPIQEDRAVLHRSTARSNAARKCRRGGHLNVPTAAALSSQHGRKSKSATAMNNPDLKSLPDDREPLPLAIPIAVDSIIPLPSSGESAETLRTNSIETHAAAQRPAEHTASDSVDISNGVMHTSGQNLRFYAARILPSWHVWTYRACFGIIVILANVSLLLAYFNTNRHLYLLAILAFMKSKDSLSTIADIIGVLLAATRRLFSPSKVVESKWIVSLVCAYAETDEQIAKTVRSLTEQDLGPHKQVICIILDGKNPDLLSRFSKIHQKLKRSYFTWKGSTGDLVIYSGAIDTTPTILIRKLQNAGKKDSLILGHDIFNYPRADMPSDTRRLRKEIYNRVVPTLIGEQLSYFDFVFCTDADSTIHTHSLRKLADALARDEAAVAACGILMAELTVPEVEWTTWHLYQQFQYTFGQYVRRQAEGLWGRVTCLPGCITMLTVRPEMGAAISMYAKPVTTYNILEHQVQYLGTDRRLTYCILAQGSNLKSLFVPEALCETVVPDSLEHYLSQRRRWASNAYFNDYYYAAGKNQVFVTRLFAVIDIVRQTLVFYRVINTALFIMSLVQRFYIAKIIPTLILTKAPATWYILLILAREKVLRRRLHKLLLGMCINQVISPFLSVIVFANVLLNMGSQVWGTTGVSTTDPRHPPTPYTAIPPESAWSPTRLASLVRTAIVGDKSQARINSCTTSDLSAEQHEQLQTSMSISIPQTPGDKSALTTSLPQSDVRHRTPGRSIIRN